MRNTALKTSFTLLPLMICTGLYLFHLSLIWRYSVDVPFEDEWASFEPNQLPSGLSFSSLIVQHNEHRLVTTRLLVWLQYRINGWNLAVHQIINFLLYGVTLLTLLWVLMSDGPPHVGVAVLWFAPYLLSPINRANHFWGYQSQLHFWLFFLVLGCYFLIRETDKWSDTASGTMAAILSMYSMAGGVISDLVLLGMYGFLTAVRVRSSKNYERHGRYYLRAAFVLGFLGAAILFWLSGYSKPPYHPALVLPYESKFWSYFLNIVAFGFGFDQVSNILGVFCLLVVVLPVVGSAAIYGRSLPVGLWRSITLTLAVLGVLASVSSGRAGFGIGQSKESRYFELAMPLLPLCVFNWTLFLQAKKSLMAAVVASFWIICLISFSNNWRQFRFYKQEAARRQTGLKCLAAYYEGKGDGNCPTIFPVPLPARLLEGARVLNVSFYRKIASQRGGQ
jgi:hypothetical protein